MPIHQLAPIRIAYRDRTPEFPVDAEVHAELTPPELFGEDDLTGRLRLSPPGGAIQLTTNLFHGGIASVGKGRLDPCEADASLFDMSFRLRGRTATLYGTLVDEKALAIAIRLCGAFLPGVLSNALSAPVDVDRIYGTVDQQPFLVETSGTFYVGHFVTDRRQQIEQALTRISSLDPAIGDRVCAAQRYLNHAQWLAYAARHPQQFAGERILNLHKAVEVLYPHSGSIDELRIALARLGLRKNVVELFASLANLRNSVDVGHPHFGFMTGEEFTTFHDFLFRITMLTDWLVAYTIELHAASPESDNAAGTPASVSAASLFGRRSAELSKTMDMVRMYLEDVDPLRPRTFHASNPQALVEEYEAKIARSARTRAKRERKSKR